MISLIKYLAFSTASALVLTACGNNGAAGDNAASSQTQFASLAPAGWADAAVLFVDADGAPAGSAEFKNTPDGGVLMRVELIGLAQGWHGIHLHQVADCSDGAEGFKASGGHVDPRDMEHGLLNPAGPEPADLPNIYAGADGRATAEIHAGAVALDAEDAAVRLLDDDGFAVIVHESPDDHMTQPIGGAGARVACAAVTSG